LTPGPSYFAPWWEKASILVVALVVASGALGVDYMMDRTNERREALRTALSARCESLADQRRIVNDALKDAGQKYSLSVPDCAKL
jgi:hypothetical protein